MGIADLNKFLADKNPDIFVTIDIFDLQGHRVAIDGNCVGYMLMHRAIKRCFQRKDFLPLSREVILESWMKMWVEYLKMYLGYGITPVMVIDGEAPEAKDDTRANREEKGRKAREALEFAIQELDGSDLTRDRYRKAMLGSIYVSRVEMRLAFDMISDAGVPSFVAPGEGERFCTSLCREGLVATVDSRDTDTLAMGCPTVINNISGSQVKVVSLARALESLECSQDFFTDLCIMGGCDFNSNIPGIRLKKALPLLQKAGCIEGVSLARDVSMLNYEKCRELFAYEPSGLSDEDMVVTRDLGPSTKYVKETYLLRQMVDSCLPGHFGQLEL